MWVLKNIETGLYASNRGHTANINEARTFTRKATATQCRRNYAEYPSGFWSIPYEQRHTVEEEAKAKWVATEVFLTEASNAEPAQPPPPSEPEDPLEAAGLIFRPVG